MNLIEDFDAARAGFSNISERSERFGLGSDVVVIETTRAGEGDASVLGSSTIGPGADLPLLSVDITVRQAAR